jgi:hypothetical protein
VLLHEIMHAIMHEEEKGYEQMAHELLNELGPEEFYIGTLAGGIVKALMNNPDLCGYLMELIT